MIASGRDVVAGWGFGFCFESIELFRQLADAVGLWFRHLLGPDPIKFLAETLDDRVSLVLYRTTSRVASPSKFFTRLLEEILGDSDLDPKCGCPPAIPLDPRPA